MFLYDTLSETWAATVAEEPLTLRQKADVQLALTHVVQSAVQAVELMYRLTERAHNARFSHMVKASFTRVGSLADSPEPPLRQSPAAGHAAEILDV